MESLLGDHPRSIPHLVILGNPWIGKPYFGYVFLLRLALLGATVVNKSGPLKRRYLYFEVCRFGLGPR